MKRLFASIYLMIFIAAVLPRPEAATSDRSLSVDRLLIGLIPEQNLFKQMDRYEPLADYLSSKTGKRVELRILTRYGNIIDNFVSLGLDGAFFGSFTYALAHKRLGVEVLARPEGLDGKSTYHGLIFVRRDGGIRTIEDMKGRTFAFVDKATTAGYLLPLAYFKEHGIENYGTYLKESYFAGTHEDVISDVLDNKADIGAAKNTVFDRLAKTDGRVNRDLVILARSPDVPENGLAVRRELDDSMKRTIKALLLDMHRDPSGKAVLKNLDARRFIETTYEDYEPVFKYANEIKLNLETYDYMN